MEITAQTKRQPSDTPFDYTFEEFKSDMCWVFYLQAQMVAAMTDLKCGLRFLGKVDAVACTNFDPECIPSELNFVYDDIRQTPFARSLEAMYRYAYYGEMDYTIEPLGPGGYHIVMAAIIHDLAKSSLVNFWMHIGGQGSESVMNCLRTAELANARLVLEGEERFFNFEGDDDYDSLWISERDEPPQGGYGHALTIRQMALLANMGEPTIRTAANPKRPHHIPTYPLNGRILIAVQDAKEWLQKKGRYVPIKPAKDIHTLELAERHFVNINDLLNAILMRAIELDSNPVRQSGQRANLKRLWDQYGFSEKDISALENLDFINKLADLLCFPRRLFALRVEELLLDEKLKALRQELRTEAHQSLS